MFAFLPYGNVWRAGRRMFTKYFNPSNPITNSQPREIIYVRRFLGQLLLKPNDFFQHVRTYVPIYYFSSHFELSTPFFRISLVGSNTLSMTYSINVRPYNDPYIKIVEDAVSSLAELLIPGAFFVDIIPILKYVPEWFPGAKFQRKAAVMREHAVKVRNATFAATEEIMVCNSSPFLGFLLMLHIRSQASGSDYDSSLVSETLKEIHNSDTPSQDINLLKDTAVVAYLG
jgi:hypothetical protein